VPRQAAMCVLGAAWRPQLVGASAAEALRMRWPRRRAPHLSCGLPAAAAACTHCSSLSAEYLPRARQRCSVSQRKYLLDRHLQAAGGGAGWAHGS
jgi:hypothetical protein